MKKLIVLFLMIIFCAPVFADVAPYYTGALSKRTIGFIQMPPSFTLYKAPQETSQVLETVSWTTTEVKLKNRTEDPAELFAVLNTKSGSAFCMVIDSDEDDWYQIIYDKAHSKAAWVKAQKTEDFWGLKDFYSHYGMKNGLVYMKNVDYRKRGIYSSPSDTGQKLGGFTLIQSIRLNKLSGNWALVTVVDFDSKPKIGYIRWREDDGMIIMFPRLGE